jgi:hypothetical protein
VCDQCLPTACGILYGRGERGRGGGTAHQCHTENNSHEINIHSLIIIQSITCAALVGRTYSMLQQWIIPRWRSPTTVLTHPICRGERREGERDAILISSHSVFRGDIVLSPLLPSIFPTIEATVMHHLSSSIRHQQEDTTQYQWLTHGTHTCRTVET